MSKVQFVRLYCEQFRENWFRVTRDQEKYGISLPVVVETKKFKKDKKIRKKTI